MIQLDLTDGRQTTEIVTAQEVYDLGIKRGTKEEREAVIKLLNAHEITINDSITGQDALWTVRAIIKSGGHRKEKP